jgi:hypothetical protein
VPQLRTCESLPLQRNLPTSRDVGDWWTRVWKKPENDNLVTKGDSLLMSTMSAVFSALARSGSVATPCAQVILWCGPAVTYVSFHSSFA